MRIKTIVFLAAGVFFSCLFLSVKPTVAATRYYTDSFLTKTKIDVEKTSAFVDTNKHRVSLQPIDMSTVGSTLLTGNSIDQIVPCGSKWLIVSGFQVLTYDGKTIAALTPYVQEGGIMNRNMPRVACNDSKIALIFYQMLAPTGGLANVAYSYDGTTLTQLTFPTLINESYSLPLELLPQAIGQQWILSDPELKIVYLYDGTSAIKTQRTTNQTEVEGDFVIIHNHDYVIQLKGVKTFNLTAATDIYKIEGATKMGSNWFISGLSGKGILDRGQRALVKYDGKTFVDLTDNLGSLGAGTLAGQNSFYLINTTYEIKRYNGEKFWTYLSGVSANSIGWNGSYWLVGTWFNGKEGLFRLDKKASDADTVQSKKINTVDRNITNITVNSQVDTPKMVFSIAAAKIVKPSIVYYVSNNGGKKWQQATLGKKLIFTTKGKDLRWKAVLKRGSNNTTSVLKKISLRYSL